jgi:hypothetical protein
MQSVVVPGLPFEILSMYVMEVRVKERFLTVVDFSDYFEMDFLHNMESETIIEVCKRNLASLGVPKLYIYTDMRQCEESCER